MVFFFFFLGSNLEFFTRDLDFPCIAIDLYNFIICWSLLAKGVYPKPKLEKKKIPNPNVKT